jgi:hypothetical protein
VDPLVSVIESQIDEIAAHIPSTGIPKLRRDHEVWKAARDAECALQGRIKIGELVEFECISIELEEYYQNREVWLIELEEERDRR